jgi:hypothetical protein
MENDQLPHICINRSAFTFTFNSPLILCKMKGRNKEAEKMKNAILVQWGIPENGTEII